MCCLSNAFFSDRFIWWSIYLRTNVAVLAPFSIWRRIDDMQHYKTTNKIKVHCSLGIKQSKQSPSITGVANMRVTIRLIVIQIITETANIPVQLTQLCPRVLQEMQIYLWD